MNSSERIIHLIDYLQLNPKSFAETLGYERPQVMYDIIKGKTKNISHNLANKIVSEYTYISRVWLLTGDGTMVSEADNNSNTDTHVHYNASGINTVRNGSASPYNSMSNNDESDDSSSQDSHSEVVDLTGAPMVLLIPVSAQGSPLNNLYSQGMAHNCEHMISPVKGADFAIQVYGESMAPEYPEGSRVFVKRIKNNSFIEWGKVFVLDTCNGTILRALVPSEREDCVRCVSLNPDPMYAPFDVKKEDIYDIYRVLLCMSMK